MISSRRLARDGLAARWAPFLASAGAFALIYAIAVWTPPGQWLDARLFDVAQLPFPEPLASILAVLARVIVPWVLLAVVMPLAAVAAVRGQWRCILASSLTLTTSVGLARLLRLHFLGRPDFGWYGYPHNTLPSTHMAVTSAALLALRWLWPWAATRRVRTVAIGIFGMAGLGNVVGYAHRPSDVLAAPFLALAMAAAAGASLRVPLYPTQVAGSSTSPWDSRGRGTEGFR